MRRTTRLLLGIALLAGAGVCVLLAVSGFTTELASADIGCGAPVREAMPEKRPPGLTPDEVEYVELTGNYTAVREHRAEVIGYLEAKTCGAEARSMVWKYGLGAVVGWSAGGAALRAAFKRKPKAPSLPKPPVPAPG